MGTVKTCGDKARLKVQDVKIDYLDPDVLGFMNDILENIYQTLVNVSSNLVYAIGNVITVADTEEYTPSFSFDGFLREGSWLDGEDTFLAQVSETDKIKWDYSSTTSQPEAFYVTEDGKVGYLWVPDAVYTVHHAYWKPLTALTDYDANDLPWGGIWNRAIQRLLIVELLGIPSKENVGKIEKQLGLVGIEWDKAMSMVYQRGVRQERQVSDMFSIGGI